MSKEDYLRRKGLLVEAVNALEHMLKVVEAYKVLISKKTEGYVVAIASQEAPFPNTSFYLKKWFRTFVGIKDEAMLLINGELIRNYHFKVHEKFVHTREHEQHYYTSKAELLGLSSCCVDGINYEIRMIEKAFKKLMRGDEGDSINMLGDRARNVEISLDALCKFVDSYAGILQKELRKRVEHVSSAALEIKHKAENLTVHFKQNMTTCASFSITCQEARKGSRKEALYSAIEEPKNSVSVQQHADPAFGANKGSSFRTRMVVTDATDEEYQQEVLRQRQERQEAERRRAALEAAKGPDFGFEFSIDQEKRHAGAFELMAVPGAALKVDDDMAAPGSRPGTPLPHFAASPAPAINTLQSTPLRPELNVLREVSTIKVKVVVHNAAASMDPAQLLKIKVPGTNVVAFTHVTSRSVVQLYASVAIVRPVNFAELKGGSGVPVAGSGVPAEQVLEDLCRQLWLGMPLATPGPGDHSAYSAYMCLPASISVNAAKFTGGELLHLPSQRDLAEKRYLVKVDDRESTAVFTSSIAKWLATFDEEETFMVTKQHLFALRPLIQRLCDCLSDPAAVLDLASLSHLAGAAAAPVPVRPGAAEQQVPSYVEKLVQLAGAQAGSGWQISIRGSAHWGRHLRVLMTHASHFDAGAAGSLTAAALADFAASGRHDVSVGSSFHHLQSLDFQHNRVLTYVDHPWELLLITSTRADQESDRGAGVAARGREGEALLDSEPMDLDLDAPFESLASTIPAAVTSASTPAAPDTDFFGQFLLCVLLQSPALRALDLSHCAASEVQAAVLGRGLATALRARNSAGLAPLETVAARGLQTFPAVASELLSQLKASVQEQESGGPCLVGVRSLDLSGHHFVI